MFHSARLKLTTWYLLIIMFISAFFSILIFHEVSLELERGFRRVELRHHAQDLGLHLPRRFSLRKEDLRPELQDIAPRFLFVDDLEDAKHALIFRLFMVNGIILVVSAVASYVMAGKTLAPIERAMEEQKRFVADASHELRTPLTALKTSIEVALRDKRLSRKQAKNVLKDNLNDIDHLTELSQKLLHLSRLQQGVNPNFSKVNLSKVIKNSVMKIKPLAKEKQIEIKTDLTSCEIKAQPEQIQEMLTLFLDNAIKYTPQKGKVFVSLTKQKKQAVIKIRDTGIGISEDHLPRIYDRFYRIDSARVKDKVDGFGLGLSLAKKIIKAHKGTVKVQSKVGKGTTFTITLPL